MYLLEIASYIIGSNQNLKNFICPFYAKNLNITDLNLIIKFYEIVTDSTSGSGIVIDSISDGTESGIDSGSYTIIDSDSYTIGYNIIDSGSYNIDGSTNRYQCIANHKLLIRHVLLDKFNYFYFINFLKCLNYSSAILIEIINEFLLSESKEKEVFLIQLLLVQICQQTLGQEVIDRFMYNMNMRTLNYCKSGNWDLLYKSLTLSTLTKTLPVNLKDQIEILCKICDLDVKEFKVNLDEVSYATRNNALMRIYIKNKQYQKQFIYFKEDLKILTKDITAFNCLCQLLKLLNESAEVEYFINYIRKRKGTSDLL